MKTVSMAESDNETHESEIQGQRGEIVYETGEIVYETGEIVYAKRAVSAVVEPDKNVDSLLRDIGGCGRFQIIIISIAYIPKAMMAFTGLFMSFGIYDPGWKCLDNMTQISVNTTTDLQNNETFVIVDSSFQTFNDCQRIQFNTDISTIVSEWSLVSGQSWIPPVIIAIQMTGVLVGSYMVGYIGDTFGRKWALCISTGFNAVLTLITLFSVSWVMFAVLQFCLGITISFFRFSCFVYSSEFITPKWRASVASIPSYGLGAIMFALCAMLTKNWRHVIVINTVFASLTSMVLPFLPRSLRWLIVRERGKEALDVANKIARCNKSPQIESYLITSLIRNNKDENRSKLLGIGQLFRRGTRKNTFAVSIIFLTLAATYYSISFGIKALPGNFFTNLIIYTCSANVANIVAAIVPNVIGRKMTLVSSLGLSAVSLLGVVGFCFVIDDLKDKGILALAMCSLIFVSVAWYTMIAYLAELYPTVIRSTAAGYGSMMAQIGAIVAPFIIPKTPDTVYISYLAIALLNVLCCISTVVFPETKGNPLADNWNTENPS